MRGRGETRGREGEAKERRGEAALRAASYLAHCVLVLEMYACAAAGEVVRALRLPPHDRRQRGVKENGVDPFDPY